MTTTQVTDHLTANDLMVGDVFPSHDDLVHRVTRILDFDGDLVVTVDTGVRSYTVEYDPSDPVNLEAW